MLQTTIIKFNWAGLNSSLNILIPIILIYLSIILYLTYFIYSLLTKKNKINYYQYISIVKNKDFIFLKMLYLNYTVLF